MATQKQRQNCTFCTFQNMQNGEKTKHNPKATRVSLLPTAYGSNNKGRDNDN